MLTELFQPAAALTAAIISRAAGKQDPQAAADEFLAVYRALREVAITIRNEERGEPRYHMLFE